MSRQQQSEEGWLQALEARTWEAVRRMQAARSRLGPELHPQIDFFVADVLDAVPPKDDMGSMEHPIFALAPKDQRVREYEHNGARVRVEPGYNGCATMHDKDVWIYAISHLVAAHNDGRPLHRTLRFTANDFLVSTNRALGGRGYKLLVGALNRLAGTRIETTIETGAKRTREGFGLLESWRVESRSGRMVSLEVTLPDWLFRVVEAKQVLTISRDYFRLSSALDRRIYELARKHCGAQSQWRVSLGLLRQKSGSLDVYRNFAVSMREIVAADDLPDYTVEMDNETHMVTFRPRAKQPDGP